MLLSDCTHPSWFDWDWHSSQNFRYIYIGHTDDSKGPALKRLISTEKQAALKLTTFTIAITQIASYKWFWDKLLLIMPYILCTHYKVTILPSLRPAPTTVPLWYVLNKLLYKFHLLSNLKMVPTAADRTAICKVWTENKYSLIIWHT